MHMTNATFPAVNVTELIGNNDAPEWLRNQPVDVPSLTHRAIVVGNIGRYVPRLEVLDRVIQWVRGLTPVQFGELEVMYGFMISDTEESLANFLENPTEGGARNLRRMRDQLESLRFVLLCGRSSRIEANRELVEALDREGQCHVDLLDSFEVEEQYCPPLPWWG